MNFEDQRKTSVIFHLEEHQSAAHLLQIPDKDEYARENIAPKDGIKKSRFVFLMPFDL